MSMKKPTRTTTTVEVTTTSTARARTTTASLARAGLTSEEERVMRTRRGIGAPLGEPLALKHTETDKARAALLSIEREMVMKMHRRVQEEQSRKAKIVDSLRVGAKPKR